MRHTELYESQVNIDKYANKVAWKLLQRWAGDPTFKNGGIDGSQPFDSGDVREALIHYEELKALPHFGPEIRQNHIAEEYFRLARKMIITETDVFPESVYVKWVFDTYINGGVERWQDIWRTIDAVTNFHRYKNIMRIKDIFQYHTLIELEDAVEEVKRKSSFKVPKKLSRTLIKNNEAIVFHKDSDYSLIIPKSLRAAILFGMQTRWCTAGTNMFGEGSQAVDPYGPIGKVQRRENLDKIIANDYGMSYMNHNGYVTISGGLDTDKYYSNIFTEIYNHPFFDYEFLAIVIDSKRNRKFQIAYITHSPFHSIEARDERDSSVDFYWLILRYPEIILWLRSLAEEGHPHALEKAIIRDHGDYSLDELMDRLRNNNHRKYYHTINWKYIEAHYGR